MFPKRKTESERVVLSRKYIVTSISSLIKGRQGRTSTGVCVQATEDGMTRAVMLTPLPWASGQKNYSVPVGKMIRTWSATYMSNNEIVC